MELKAETQVVRFESFFPSDLPINCSHHSINSITLSLIIAYSSRQHNVLAIFRFNTQFILQTLHDKQDNEYKDGLPCYHTAHLTCPYHVIHHRSAIRQTVPTPNMTRPCRLGALIVTIVKVIQKLSYHLLHNFHPLFMTFKSCVLCNELL